MAYGTATDIKQPLTQRVEVSDELVANTLRPYRPDCRYLKSAALEYELGGPQPQVAMRAKFSIPQSCYIADTGHFNAVEFNICYNQLAYTIVAACIERQILPVFNHFSLEEYHRQQLGNFLIVHLESEFRAQINARDFEGTIRSGRMSKRKGTVFFKSSCVFNDAGSGLARGEVLFAILNEREQALALHGVQS